MFTEYFSPFFFVSSLDNISWLSIHALLSLFLSLAREMCYFLLPLCAAAVLRWTEHSGR